LDKERNVLGMRLKYELEGKSVLDLEPITPKKEHCYYQKFPKQIAEFDLLRESVATLQRNVPRNYKQKSYTIIVMLVVDKHSIQTSKYYFNCAVTLPYGSNLH
jgi:DNA polymerase V